MIHEISGELVLSRFEIRPSCIPGLLALRNEEYGDIQPLEQKGYLLRNEGFLANDVEDFVKNVFAWGKGDRNLARVLENLPRMIAKLNEACAKIDACSDAKGIGRAIEGMRLPYFRMSFASKIIRFIYPDRAVIFDSVIRSGLGYPESADGYGAFLDDCQAILDRSRTEYTELRVCDIEAAIFMKLRGRS